MGIGVFSTIDKAIDGAIKMRDLILLKRTNYLIKQQSKRSSGEKQYLDVYWDDSYMETSLNWGENTVWNEIQYLLASAEGKVLDIACGPASVMSVLDKTNKNIKSYGCDISDRLVEIAIKMGISKDRIKVADATNLNYKDNYFDYSYSIGSLEHFTEEGIDAFVDNCFRVTKVASYHQIPTCKEGRLTGWINLQQSFHNMPISWWKEKFLKKFPEVTLNIKFILERCTIRRHLVYLQEKINQNFLAY